MRFCTHPGTVAATVTLGLAGVAAPPAAADPTDFPVLVGVGSDTTHDVMSGIARRTGGTPLLLGSWAATGTSPIKTRATACSLPRPHGTGTGIGALHRALDLDSGCVDFVRSPRGPVDRSTVRLTWVPFAGDATAVAVRSDSPVRDGLDLTTHQLKSIYSCTTTSINGVRLTPLLPQYESGRRELFLRQLGLPEAEVGSCVGLAKENDGRALDSSGDIVPYSVAQWIAQTSEVVHDIHGVATLGRTHGVAPTVRGRLNTAHPYFHHVYNVVPTAKLDDPVFKAAFAGSASKVCAQTSTIETYGFGTLGSGCGGTSDPALKGDR
ncbi:hypothetical protein [Streptomyces lasiicapitis]|uniref:hypothetical protein n=1 Tax=Streptomyces lasiicapitis TaxID=1923961 RepID=UPI00364A2D43